MEKSSESILNDLYELDEAVRCLQEQLNILIVEVQNDVHGVQELDFNEGEVSE
jgi:hypothetical protein